MLMTFCRVDKSKRNHCKKKSDRSNKNGADHKGKGKKNDVKREQGKKNRIDYLCRRPFVEATEARGITGKSPPAPTKSGATRSGGKKYVKKHKKNPGQTN